MAIKTSRLVASAFVALSALAFAASSDQVIFSNAHSQRLSRPGSNVKTVKKSDRSVVFPSGGEKIQLRPENPFSKPGDSSSCRDSIAARFFTFDDYWPSEEFPNTTYERDWDGYLEFNRFNVMWASEAHEAGFLDSKDLNCAVSPPINLYNTPLNYTTPSVIRSNATGLAEAGLSEFFDIVAWSWKPMGPYPKSFGLPWLELDLYKVNDTAFEYVDGVGTIFGWFEDEDEDKPAFFEPDTWAPAEFFLEPWGTGVNWIEINTWYWDDEDDDDKEPARRYNYCLDNLVLVFYKKE